MDHSVDDLRSRFAIRLPNDRANSPCRHTADHAKRRAGLGDQSDHRRDASSGSNQPSCGSSQSDQRV